MSWRARGSLVPVIAAVAVLAGSCGGEKVESGRGNRSGVADVSDPAWAALAEKSIWFGHQSVGFNMVEGMSELLAEHPSIPLRIVETRSPDETAASVFAHGRNGENKQPETKIDAFARLMDEGMGYRVDIAFFKFCYVDIDGGADVDALFDSYRTTMTRLKADYPDTLFVHVTAPVTRVQSGPKAWVKKVIGRTPGGAEENIPRNRFNRKMREEYAGKEPLFDLAELEATATDGGRTTFNVDGVDYEALTPDYTDDGGHLNEKGRRWVAEQLLVFLSGLAG